MVVECILLLLKKGVSLEVKESDLSCKSIDNKIWSLSLLKTMRRDSLAEDSSIFKLTNAYKIISYKW